MKAALLILPLLLAGAAIAQPVPRLGATPRPAQVEAVATARAPAAMLRGLDKITGATSDLPLKVGEAVGFGRLEVRLGECRYPAEDPGSDAFAELTITDRSSNRTVFAGWMIASSPALSALDDARYDVWVVDCTTPAITPPTAPESP